MKKLKNIIILFVIVSMMHSQSMYDTYSGFTVPHTPVLPGSEVHPSLYFTNADTQSIRLRQTINNNYATQWTKITTNINSYKTRTASTQDENDRPRMAKYCAFGWIINKDAAAKLKAIEALMIAYDNVPRTSTAADFGGNYDEIYRATWLQNYCETYDWIKNELTAVQDSTIRAKLAAEIILLTNNMTVNTRYAPRPHNHRSKPAYAIGTAALTFSSDSRASAWLDSSLTEQNTVTKYMYSADGIYREGTHYNIYSLVNGLPFLWQYKNVSGVDLFPYYAPVWENAVRVRFGRGLLHTFEDSYLKPMMTHLAAGAYTNTPTMLHTTAKLSEVMQWNWFNTYVYTSNYTGATNDVAWDIEEYLLYNSAINQTAPNIAPSQNLQYGQMMFRRSWNYNDASNRTLIFHGVAEADNHNHPDQLAIMFEAENSIMATAPGYGPDGFSDLKRDSWYLTPFSNNIVTVDSLAPTDPVANRTPSTLHFFSGNDIEYGEKQAQYINGAIWKRGISFPRKNYWVVRDLIRSNANRTSRWYMHSRGVLTTSGINARWTMSSDTYNSAAIFDCFAVSSSGNSFSTASGYVSFANANELSAPYIKLEMTDTVASYLSILYPRSSGSSAPAVTNLSIGNVVALSLQNGDTTDIHISKKDYQLQTAAGISTDAAYGYVSKNSIGMNSCSIVEGTLLQYNGSTILNSTQRITVGCSFLNGTKVYVDAESIAANTLLQIKLPFLSAAVTDMRLNGNAKTFSVINDSLISISGSPGTPLSVELFPLKEVKAGTVPKIFSLSDNYPNPFNPTTTIEFTLASTGKATVKIFSLLGVEIATLVDAVLSSGVIHRYEFHAENLPSGVYYYQLESGHQRVVKKMMVIK